MTLRITLLAAVAMTVSLTAMAAGRWQGPGWYQVVEKAQPGHDADRAIFRPVPFQSRAECLATLPPDRLASGHDEHRLDTFYDFSCVELNADPDWSR